LSISIATANPAGAEPRQIPVYTSHQTLNGYAQHAGWQLAQQDLPRRGHQDSKVVQDLCGQAGRHPFPKKYGVSLVALEAANR
jgi:hypothetical protein